MPQAITEIFVCTCTGKRGTGGGGQIPLSLLFDSLKESQVVVHTLVSAYSGLSELMDREKIDSAREHKKKTRVIRVFFYCPLKISGSA